MPGKLQVKFVSNFQISMSFLSIYLLLDGNIIHCLSFPFICCRCLVDKLWQRVPELQKLAIWVLSQTCSSSGCECNWSVFEKIHSKKCNRLEMFKLKTPTTGTKIFRLFPSFRRGTEFPEFLWGLMQFLPSLILTHVIVGYDHRPYRRGTSGFRDSGNRDACVPLLSCLSKCRNPKGTNSLS
jgi:hypothetical protein